MKIQLTPEVVSLYNDSLHSIDAGIKWAYYCQGIIAGLVMSGRGLENASKAVEEIVEALKKGLTVVTL